MRSSQVWDRFGMTIPAIGRLKYSVAKSHCIWAATGERICCCRSSHLRKRHVSATRYESSFLTSVEALHEWHGLRRTTSNGSWGARFASGSVGLDVGRTGTHTFSESRRRVGFHPSVDGR
jgi:hypothetical protein